MMILLGINIAILLPYVVRNSHVFPAKCSPPIVSSDGEYNHGVTMGLGMIPWDPMGSQKKNPMVFPGNWPPHGVEIPHGHIHHGMAPHGDFLWGGQFLGKNYGIFLLGIPWDIFVRGFLHSLSHCVVGSTGEACY